MAPSVVKAPPTTDDRREPAMPDPTADHEPELLTITEAADLLRAPVATLRYWRHRNIGPHSFRLGRRVLYRRDDLDAWVEAHRARGVATVLDQRIGLIQMTAGWIASDPHR